MDKKEINDLPEEVFEFILSFLSPYNDLKNCMMVSRNWRKSVKDVVRRMQHDFLKSISDMQIDWYHVAPEPGPTITKRYSHSSCCHGTSMYVFGGCTSTSTTFNDLWRLDLSTRVWIRPLAMGTYPSPKACATMVSYLDNLILFGGWTHPSPYPLHQAWRIFNQLHFYNPEDNRWIQVTSPVTPPAMAGHSATVHGDRMIVFGGLQKQNDGRPFASSNDIWILNLTSKTWKKQETSHTSPRPRYGQSQLALDDNHALIIGGCGGPNMLFNDVWLLIMNSTPRLHWEWKELEVRNTEYAAPHLLCHPACKVGDKMVVLSRSSQAKTTTFGGQLLRPTATRTWVPPHESSGSISNGQNGTDNIAHDNAEKCVNGKKGSFRKRRVTADGPEGESSSGASSDEKDSSSASSHDELRKSNMMPSTSSFGEVGIQGSSIINPLDVPGTSSQTFAAKCTGDFLTGPEEKKSSIDPHGGDLEIDNSRRSLFDSNEKSKCFHNTPYPSVKPNPMKNRQRQLEGLRRMEERIRSLAQRSHGASNEPCSRSQSLSSDATVDGKSSYSSRSCVRNPLTMYVADLSKVLTEGIVTWLSLQNQSTTQGPEETMLYSLVHGRGELIMFGGVHKDLGTSITAQPIRTNVAEIVSNTVHYITARKWVI